MSIARELPALSVRRPYLAAVMNILIIVAGISAIFGIEVRELPNIDRPIVSVYANYPGASPETIDAEVTSIVEGAVARVNGVIEVRSSSEENNFRIRAVFRPSADLVTAANDVREAISRVRKNLPDGVEDLNVIKADADSQAIVRLAVYSESRPIEDVTRTVEDEIVPEITAIDGVADVTLWGKRQRVLRVVVDPIRLASYKLAVGDVVAVLKKAKFDVPSGSFKSNEQEVIVRANASVTDPEAIEKLVVRDPVRIGDIGNAFFGPADAENIVRYNGRPVVSLGIIRRAQSNTVTISDGVKKAVDRLNARYRDLKIVVTSDDSVFIKGAISEVLRSLLLAIGIVVIVIAVFIGQIRAALIPAVAIPVALIGTVAAIWLMGFSLNLITLLALVLATGLVVDDSIVVLENITRLKSRGSTARAAAVIGTRQVFFAVIATTLTLVSVFVPISFLPSTAGRLFVEFGFVLACTVAISSFVALTIVPMLASRLPDKVPAPGRGIAAPFFFVGRVCAALYARILRMVLAAPLAFVGLCAIVLVGAAITYQSLGEELVPEEDRGVIRLRMTGPDGVGLDYTDRQMEKIEAILQPWLDKGILTGMFTVTGSYDLNRGYIAAPMVDWSKREVGEGAVVRAINGKLGGIPGARARVRRGNSLGLRNADGGMRFALTGNNYETIAAVADAFVLELEKHVPQLQNYRVEFNATQPQISVSIDRRRANDLGVPIENLASAVQVIVDGDEVAELTVHDKTVPVILQARAGAIQSPTDLRNLFVAARDGRLVPLSQMVTFRESAVASELDRHGQRRAVEIFADPVAGYSLREAVEAVRKVARDQLPNEIGLLFLDEAKALDETSHGVTITYLIAILIVFLVLVAQFESMRSAVIILVTVPFGVCAAIFALALTGNTINIYSQIGVLMLIGIMAKNAILMVEFADQLRAEGKDVLDAAMEASIVRFRPIAMTMVSTLLAGLPLILGSGPGIEARAAIGWVVFGGLGLAAAFTLFLTPAVYALLASRKQVRNTDTEAFERQLEKESVAPAE